LLALQNTGSLEQERSQEPNSLNKNLHEPANKFVGLVQSKPTSLCFILQNKFVGLVQSKPTSLFYFTKQVCWPGAEQANKFMFYLIYKTSLSA
jgi:hypothetical protein